MKTLGSFLVFQLIRNGHPPDYGGREAVKRIAALIPNLHDHQVGYLVIEKTNTTGAFCLQYGFEYAIRTTRGPLQLRSSFFIIILRKKPQKM